MFTVYRQFTPAICVRVHGGRGRGRGTIYILYIYPFFPSNGSTPL